MQPTEPVDDIATKKSGGAEYRGNYTAEWTSAALSSLISREIISLIFNNIMKTVAVDVISA